MIEQLPPPSISRAEQIRFNVRKIIDVIRTGKLFTEHFHATPISDEQAENIEAKVGTLPRERILLAEYRRAELYQKRQTELKRQGAEDSKILALAAGFDGIPGSVFGQHRMIMTSLDTDHYHQPYLVKLKGIEAAAKVEANFFHHPFPDDTFLTVIFNDFDIINPQEMARFLPEAEPSIGAAAKTLPATPLEKWRPFMIELRRIMKTGGKVLIDAQFSASKKITPEEKTSVAAALVEIGWTVETRIPGSSQLTLIAQ